MWEIALTALSNDLPDNASNGAAPDDLLVKAQAGDRAAFDRLMQLFERQVLATALRLMSGNLSDAQDAAQIVFLRMHKYLPRIRTGENLAGWLYRVTANVCLDELRRKSAFVPLDDELRVAFTSEADPERQFSEAERHAALVAGLRDLPAKERAAVVLRDIEGLETEEVARILGSSPATVRSQLRSARSKLRNFISRMKRRS
jgi:RNA polymerase sigma-70 factor (ECF subfamily)